MNTMTVSPAHLLLQYLLALDMVAAAEATPSVAPVLEQPKRGSSRAPALSPK